jgi:predicted DsbA family dithiol-disulfide isomerase
VTTKLSVDIWSDIVCPWCYVGKRRFEKALAQFAHKADVEVTWHTFELDPRAEKASVDLADNLAKKYRRTREQAQQMLDQMTQTAAGEGLEIHFEKAQTSNTFDAHRVLHLALERGKQADVKERLMRGYFTEGAPIGDHATLARLAADAGLDEQEVKDVLAGDRYTDAARGDEALARELGISGVPFFVLGGRLGVSGAQTPDVLLGALEKAWELVTTAPEQEGEHAEG